MYAYENLCAFSGAGAARKRGVGRMDPTALAAIVLTLSGAAQAWGAWALWSGTSSRTSWDP